MLNDKILEKKDKNIDSFTAEYFFTGADGKKYKIYPMKLKHKDTISRLFAKFHDTYLLLNFPTPKVDLETDEFVVDENGEIVYDNEKYEAMMEVLKIATNLDEETILDVIDARNFSIVLDYYRNISQLKKEIASQEKWAQQMLMVNGESFT